MFKLNMLKKEKQFKFNKEKQFFSHDVLKSYPPSLKPTFSHLKEWMLRNTTKQIPFGAQKAYFQGFLLLVSGSVSTQFRRGLYIYIYTHYKDFPIKGGMIIPNTHQRGETRKVNLKENGSGRRHPVGLGASRGGGGGVLFLLGQRLQPAKKLLGNSIFSRENQPFKRLYFRVHWLSECFSRGFCKLFLLQEIEDRIAPENG